MNTPADILEEIYDLASSARGKSFVSDPDIRQRIAELCASSNRSGVRVVLTCVLAKIHRPEIDVRKPYTEIGSTDAFSGRSQYDEPYITPFNQRFDLGMNATTAFFNARLSQHQLPPDDRSGHRRPPQTDVSRTA